jgi:hypothetical protein
VSFGIPSTRHGSGRRGSSPPRPRRRSQRPGRRLPVSGERWAPAGAADRVAGSAPSRSPLRAGAAPPRVMPGPPWSTCRSEPGCPWCRDAACRPPPGPGRTAPSAATRSILAARSRHGNQGETLVLPQDGGQPVSNRVARRCAPPRRRVPPSSAGNQCLHGCHHAGAAEPGSPTGARTSASYGCDTDRTCATLVVVPPEHDARRRTRRRQEAEMSSTNPTSPAQQEPAPFAAEMRGAVEPLRRAG